MALAFLATAMVALAVRALAASGSAALSAHTDSRTAATLEAGATAAGVVGAGATCLAILVFSDGLGVVAVLPLALAPLFVLVADLLPRSLMQARAPVLPTPLSALGRRVLAFLCSPLRLLESGIARLVGGPTDRVVPTVGQVLSDLLHFDRPDAETPVDSPRVIRRILQFRETRVRDVMVPLVHVYSVRADAPIEEVINLVVREKLSRIPVFQQRMYDIVGIVHSFDLVGETRLTLPVERIMRPPLYVTENKLAHQQLRLMQRRGVNMAVVVDEHGGSVGIVTIEDLLEQIVGEIEDEYDQGEVLYQSVADGVVQVEGAMKIARLNELFPWELPHGDYETIAGLVVTHLGRIPRVGARLKLTNVTVEVTGADARAVRRVIVRPRPAG